MSYYCGKQYLDGGSGNYLVFLPLRKYFKLNSVVGAADYVLSWQSKGLSDEIIKPPTTTNNSLTPELNYYGTRIKIKFTRSCFTLFRMGFFGAAHGWGGSKRPPLSYNKETWHSYTLPKKD